MQTFDKYQRRDFWRDGNDGINDCVEPCFNLRALSFEIGYVARSVSPESRDLDFDIYECRSLARWGSVAGREGFGILQGGSTIPVAFVAAFLAHEGHRGSGCGGASRDSCHA
jgi:hypothetical protein